MSYSQEEADLLKEVARLRAENYAQSMNIATLNAQNKDYMEREAASLARAETAEAKVAAQAVVLATYDKVYLAEKARAAALEKERDEARSVVEKLQKRIGHYTMPDHERIEEIAALQERVKILDSARDAASADSIFVRKENAALVAKAAEMAEALLKAASFYASKGHYDDMIDINNLLMVCSTGNCGKCPKCSRLTAPENKYFPIRVTVYSDENTTATPAPEKKSQAWPCVCGDPTRDGVDHRRDGPCVVPEKKPCENCGMEGGRGLVQVGCPDKKPGCLVLHRAPCPACCPPSPGKGDPR